MAREGLRTLVVAKKVLTEDQYQDFEVCVYGSVQSLHDRVNFFKKEVWYKGRRRRRNKLGHKFAKCNKS